MSADEQIRVEFVADTSKLRKGAQEAKTSLDDVSDSAEESQSTWKRMASALSGISPTFKGLQDTFTETSEGINTGFQGMGKAATLAKLGIVGAIGAVAVKALQAFWKVGSESAKAFDSKSYDKAVAERQTAMKKLKTSVGAFTSPIINGLNKAFAFVMNGVSKYLGYLYSKLNLIYGFLKGLFVPVIDAVKTAINAVMSALAPVIEAIKGAINSITSMLGMGAVFKDSAKGAKQTAEAVDEVGEAAEYADGALQGFDKLNTMEDDGGDRDTAEGLKDSAAAMQELGEGFGTKIWDTLGKIPEFFQGLSLESIWGMFTEKAGESWETIKEKAGGVWEGVKGFGSGAWTFISGIGTTVWTNVKAFASTVWEGIKTVASTVWGVISGIASTVWGVISGIASTVWEGIKTVAVTVWNVISGVASTIWGIISTVANGVWTGIQTVATTVWNIISTPILALWGAFQTVGESAWGILEKAGQFFIDNIINPIKSAVEWILGKVEWITEKLGGVKDALGGFGEKVGGAVSGAVDSVKGFLGFSSGGVVDPNDPHLVMVGDNRREQEVISPISTMKQAFTEALREANYMGGASRQGGGAIVLQVDGKTLARATYDDLVAESNRRGRGAIA